LNFRSALKVTTLGQDLIRNMCGKFGVDPFSRSSEEVQNVSANQRPVWPYWISDWLKK